MHAQNLSNLIDSQVKIFEKLANEVKSLESQLEQMISDYYQKELELKKEKEFLNKEKLRIASDAKNVDLRNSQVSQLEESVKSLDKKIKKKKSVLKILKES